MGLLKSFKSGECGFLHDGTTMVQPLNLVLGIHEMGTCDLGLQLEKS